MPNNNLTDLEIKKALECCIDTTDKGCSDCMYAKTDCNCVEYLLKNALDLINRYEEQIATQQAEIERLKAKVNHYNYCYDYFVNKPISRIKAEAYKEFAERVKLEFYYEFDELIPSIMSDKIDNLLKELVGEDKHFADVSKTNSEIKATAYHECIEKIKKRAEHSSCSVAVNTIADNVLKELVDNNETR